MTSRIGASLVWAARLAVVATFVAAAIPKLMDPARFASDIANYQAFPHWSWNAMAAWVPALELVAAAALLTPRWRRAGALILGALTLAFSLLILSVITRGIDVSCGCFGATETASAAGWPELMRDLVLLVAIAAAAWPDFASSARDDAAPVDP